MNLKIMFTDGIINEITVERLFIIKTSSEEQHLYFETLSDAYGKGHTVPLSDIKCWEATAIPHGGSNGLTL